MATREFPTPTRQAFLPGMAEPVPTDRLFLGLFPVPSVVPRIEQIVRSLPVDIGGSRAPTRASRFHVTVHHLGDHEGLDPALLDAANAAIGRVRASAFDLALDEVSGFRGRSRHPIVLRGRDGSPGAHALWEAARVELARTVFARWLGRTYAPHLTLAYADRLPASPIAVEPVAWTASEIVLVHSLLGRGEYRILGRWPLLPR
jgi:2'-5' RNA ligase